MPKVTKYQKIELLGKIYSKMLETNIDEVFIVFNQIIIDSIGIDGLKEVKKTGWDRYMKKWKEDEHG